MVQILSGVADAWYRVHIHFHASDTLVAASLSLYIRGIALQSLYRLVWHTTTGNGCLQWKQCSIDTRPYNSFFRSLCRNHSILVTDVVVTFAGDRRAVVYSGLVDLVSAGTTRFKTIGTPNCSRSGATSPQILLGIWQYGHVLHRV
jgi:hypothetical protein